VAGSRGWLALLGQELTLAPSKAEAELGTEVRDARGNPALDTPVWAYSSWWH